MVPEVELTCLFIAGLTCIQGQEKGRPALPDAPKGQKTMGFSE
jgi:hypothetical protein